MENKNLLPTLVNKIKYTKKVRVSDIKTYLVDEYKLTKSLDKENKELRKRIENAEVINQKYDVALITLDEYKQRLKDKNSEITDLENKIKKMKEEIKLITSERNDLKLKSKKFNLEIEKIKKDGCKEYKKELKREITNLKGHISKDTILNIISNTKLNNQTK